jgi:S-adenosyl methyltransferase
VTDSSSASGQTPPKIDTSVSHSARVWNFWLGGKDYYPVDREAGEQVMAMFPDMPRIARLQRSFLARAVEYLAGEVGIRQFLDLGTGLPTANNTHQVAQAIAPESHIVYVDNDPLVLVHARALLTSAPEGACDYIDADVRDVDTILTAAAKTLDFTRPIAIMMLGIMGQLADSDNPESIIKRLLDAVVPGSYLALSDGTNTSEALNEASRRLNENAHNWYHLRSPQQITGFFDGLQLVEPGVVKLSQWRPEPTPFADPQEVPGMCGVGRKP